MEPSEIRIPSDLLPGDGRFGSGPSKVRAEAVAALANSASGYLGTSHRKQGVRSVVGRLRSGLRDLFELPDDYEVVLGNGGTTVLWDALVFGLIRERSQHLVFGEFSSKFAHAAALALHLEEPEVVSAEPGDHPEPKGSELVDVFALTHNETSTGVAMPVTRVEGGLVAVDATSAAGGLRVDPGDFDVYYFAPQKGFASDGGLWVALCSPAAIERIQLLADSDRYIPPSLDLLIALENSRQNQTYNTPALATLFLMVEQLEWILDNGGLEWSNGRCDRSADILYSWAEAHEQATPFVRDPAKRSHVVGTIDLADGVDAPGISAALRANGIVDTEPYRKLGRNQLRIAMYPAIEPDDIAQLTNCIDFAIDGLA
ncbi:MAG: phosphoserine transaminase [Actinomycetota bacterium]|nr:phosphoserine transaminase [Actinomycetota bacterium]